MKPDLPRIDISLEGRLPGAFGIARKRLAEAARFFAAESASRSGRPFAAVSVVLQDDAGSDEALIVCDLDGVLPRNDASQPMGGLSYFDYQRPELYK